MPTPSIKGLATLRWGSGSLANNDLTGAIVLRGTLKQRDGKYFEIEDNDGFTTAVAGLDDGDTLDLECLDDSAIDWPAFMDFVELVLPGRGSSAVKLINRTKSLNLVRKEAAARSLTLEYYVNIQS
jgi:hypothetical protein